MPQGVMRAVCSVLASVSGLSDGSRMVVGTAPEAVLLMCEDGGQMYRPSVIPKMRVLDGSTLSSRSARMYKSI